MDLNGNINMKIKVKFYTPIINHPDLQSRVYKNSENIFWKNRVHEQITGYKIYSSLPINSDWDLLHIKSLERQEKQNNYYNTL